MPSQRLPASVREAVTPDLRRLGAAVVGDLQRYGDDAEANLPRLEQCDAFGHRVDRIATSEGWRKLHAASATEGLVAIAYERAYGPYSRIYQVAKVRALRGRPGRCATGALVITLANNNMLCADGAPLGAICSCTCLRPPRPCTAARLR